MAVISNNGRLISSLPSTNTISDDDQLIIQVSSANNPNGVTKRVNYSVLQSALYSNLNPYPSQVNLSNVNNKFTGSFYSPSGTTNSLYTTIFRNGLTVSSGASNFQSLTATSLNGPLTGNVTGNVTGNITGNVTGNVTGNITSTGTSTFSGIDINGGTVDGSIIGGNSPADITGTIITANTRFTGNLRGDVYNNTSTKVLESGTTTPTPNGGVSDAYFYGTSSYAAKAKLAESALTAVSVGSTIFATYALSSSWATSSYTASYAKNAKMSGSFSGSFYGSLTSKRVKISGSAKLTGSFSGSHFGSFVAKRGSFTKNNIKVGFLGTSSFSVTSSYSLTSSYLSYHYALSPNTLDSYVNSYFSTTHGFGQVPSNIRVTGYCVSTDNGYSPGDEIDIAYLQYLDNDWDRVSSGIWSNATSVGFAFSDDNTHPVQYIPKTGGAASTITKSNWKVIIRAWK